jgi:hypothetical protein
MQHYIIFFIVVNALHVSSRFSAHHQELKTVHTASVICQTCLLLSLAWVSWNWFAFRQTSYNQQNATLYNILYCCQCFTCFKRFFCPSSGAQNCTHSIGYCQTSLLLPLAWVSWNWFAFRQTSYNPQNATLFNILYYCQCSTCFKRFFRPSSGAQNCTPSISYLSNLFATTASMGELELVCLYPILCVQF